MKFKKGDKVIVISVRNSWHFRLGETGIVKSYYTSTSGNYCYFTSIDESEPLTECQLELKSVYDSPLYKALS